MKRAISVFLFLCIMVNLICVPSAIAVAAVYEDVWEYTTSGTEATITKYLGAETTVTVPSTVSDGTNTYTVTAIGDGSSSVNVYFINVTLPSTIKKINTNAFKGMRNKNFAINFPEGLEEIGNSAFFDSGISGSLVNIVFPSTLKKIGASAFYQCTRIKTITFNSKTAPTIVSVGAKEAFWNLSAKPVVYYPEDGIGYDDASFRRMFASSNATPVEGKNALTFAYIGTNATAAPTITATPKPTATPTPIPTPTPVPTPTPEPDWAENINLLINEVSSSNVTTIKDGFGNNADWIEIYNASDGAVRLDGFGLSNSADEPYKYVLPNIVIPKGKYLLVFTSENVPEGATGVYANFDIPKTGGTIILTDPTGILSDSVTVPALDDDQSYGRVTDGGKDFEILTPSPGATNEGDEFDVLRRKWVEQITGGDNINVNDPTIAAQIQLITETANGYWESLNKSANRTYLWSEYSTTSSSSYLTSAYGRLFDMAVAYKTVGSPLYENEAFLNDIISALEWMSINRYNSGKSEYDNWWDWDIGVPRHLVNIIALLYDELPQELKETYYQAILTFVPDSIYKSWTGANKVWLTSIGMAHGMLAKDSDRISNAVGSFSSVIQYSTKGDGFYTDGSFIQHTNYAYTGGYGLSLISDMSKVMAWLGGSEWDIDSTKKDMVYDWIYDSFEPLVYKGNFMEMVAGREISRANVSGYTRGKSLINALILFTEFAPKEHKANFTDMINRWIKENTYDSFFENNKIYFIIKGKELLSDEYSEEKSMVKFFPAMDRVVMKRPDFAYGIALHSASRTKTYESINNENKRGWYTASGTAYLYNGDLAQYADGYWPTINSYNLPGVSLNTNKSLNTKGTVSDYAGGVDLNDMYGVVGFRFNPSYYTHDSKKSYFLFDDEVVFVGNVSANVNARTVIENRKIDGDNTFVIDNVETNTTKGTTVTTTNPKWAHLEGTAKNSDIGYYFPTDTKISSLRETRTDKWTSINSYGTYQPYNQNITNSFLSMWVDHGATPNNEPYAYVVMPNKSVAETESYSKNPDIVIDTQTEKVHAVKETKLGITAANFFEAEVAQSTDFRCDNMASVIMQQNGTELSVSLSDPTMKTTGNITLEIARSGLAATKLDSNVKVVSLTPTIKVEIDVTNKKGLGSDMEFTLASPDYVKLPAFVPPPEFINVAPEATIEVDSKHTSGNYKPEYLVDGIKNKDSSRWVSDQLTKEHYVIMTWNEPQKISNVKIWSGFMDTAGNQVRDFTVDWWNGTKWVTVATVTNNDKDAYSGKYNDLEFDTVTTTKLRIYITKGSSSTNDKYARILEIEAGRYVVEGIGLEVESNTVTRDKATNTLSGNVSLVVADTSGYESITLILAIYNSDDVLVKTKIGTVDNTNNRADFENISVSDIKDDNYVIKAYAWQDFESCMPVAVPVDVK